MTLNTRILTLTLASALASLHAAPGMAEENKWIGDHGGAWENKTNWSAGRVPIETDDVVIEGAMVIITVTESYKLQGDGSVKVVPKKMNSLRIEGTNHNLSVIILGAPKQGNLGGFAGQIPITLAFLVKQDVDIKGVTTILAAPAAPDTSKVPGGSVHIISSEGSISIGDDVFLTANSGSSDPLPPGQDPERLRTLPADPDANEALQPGTRRGDGGYVELSAAKDITIGRAILSGGSGGAIGSERATGGDITLKAGGTIRVRGDLRPGAGRYAAGGTLMLKAVQRVIIREHAKIWGGTSLHGLATHARGGDVVLLANQEVINRSEGVRPGSGRTGGRLLINTKVLTNDRSMRGGISYANNVPGGNIIIQLDDAAASTPGHLFPGNFQGQGSSNPKQGKTHILGQGDMKINGLIGGSEVLLALQPAGPAAPTLTFLPDAQIVAQELVCLDTNDGTIDFSQVSISGGSGQDSVILNPAGFTNLVGTAELPEGFGSLEEAMTALVEGSYDFSDEGCAPDWCDPDLNGDGVVNELDVEILELVWGFPLDFADLNQDGMVDADDLGILLALWGACS
ncbi:MAG TPA: hypothetical protein PKC43_10065 [Phycisphaerales bacterium]|nr:hypothetical protein [Phycisphaerales bacterium]HMP37780.1 hypothetical protein [Phycisphaerales bacterium]